MVETPLPLRVRLLFANNILTKSQKKDGLKRSWVLLKPQLETISDLVLYIIQSFDLHDSCPDGIILSTDGFVLPEFESTTILSDKDVISVKKKKSQLLDAYKAIEGANIYIQDDIVEKHLLPSGVKLLANEEFDKGSGGCQSETDEDEDDSENRTLPLQTVPMGDVVSKKRKASSNMKSPRKKRQRLVTPAATQKNHVTTPQKKKKHGNESKQEAFSSLDANEKCIKDVEPNCYSGELEESKKENKLASGASDGVKKVTRSTLRKRSKRMLKRALRDKAKDECEIQQPVKDLSTNSGPKIYMAANCTQESDASDAEGDLVPVVIRPGHIRFTRCGKEKDVQQNQHPNGLEAHQNGAWDEQPTSKMVSSVKRKQVEEPYCWNGITSKKKGQKWGRDKQSTPWKESRDHNSYSSLEWGAGKQATPSWKNSGAFSGPPPSSWATRKQSTSDWKGSRNSNGGKKNNNYVNFDKLLPLIDSPVAGDIIAYRLLELSSSWCPELSSIRVGKITSFDPDSNRIILVPVTEYPLNLGKRTDDADDDFGNGQPPASSVYNEDGSLETDYSSLNDVRILKRGELTLPEVNAVSAANGASVTSTNKRDNETQDATKGVVSIPSTNKQGDEALDCCKNGASGVSNQELHTPAPVNGKKDPWEEISDAISAKKAQLSVEDAWNKKESSAKRTWSYRTLRGSGIGATMARLRAQNGV